MQKKEQSKIKKIKIKPDILSNPDRVHIKILILYTLLKTIAKFKH